MTAASIRAKVRYLNSGWKGREELARIGDRDSRRANTTPTDVDIFDARARNECGELDLDNAGFVLSELASTVTDFHDESQVTQTYYPEVASLVRELTGADQVFFSQHLVRTESTESFNRAYARFIHCDYSLGHARDMARRTLERRNLDGALADRWEFAWYNGWQPIEREVQQNPLTLIDATTVEDADVLDYYYTGYGNDGRSSMPVFNANHRFFYFPHMQRKEIMVFKQLDTRAGRARACPHTSFDDSTAPADALGRRSIETRMMCVFESNA
ncbi:MAG: CmcJ/NvfI family oxidoreductase [Pseudomonadales bacterium]